MYVAVIWHGSQQPMAHRSVPGIIRVTTIATGIPQYLWQADCSNSSPPTELTSGRTADCECTVYECTPIYYKIPVLTLESNPQNCNPFSLQEAVWSWELKEIPVACSCNRKCASCEEWNQASGNNDVSRLEELVLNRQCGGPLTFVESRLIVWFVLMWYCARLFCPL